MTSFCLHIFHITPCRHKLFTNFLHLLQITSFCLHLFHMTSFSLHLFHMTSFCLTCFRYYLIFLEFETFFNPQQPAWIKAFNTKLTIDLERKYLPLQDTPMWDIFVKHFGKKKTGKLKVSKKVRTFQLKIIRSAHFGKNKLWSKGANQIPLYFLVYFLTYVPVG